VNTWAIFVIALFAWLAFDRLVSEVGSILRARARGRDCPCSSIGALTIDCGTLVPDPLGNLVPGTPEDAARKVH
jgi:hypothetical protein